MSPHMVELKVLWGNTAHAQSFAQIKILLIDCMCAMVAGPEYKEGII